MKKQKHSRRKTDKHVAILKKRVHSEIIEDTKRKEKDE